jgi:Family of unknown function (DUF6130)
VKATTTNNNKQQQTNAKKGNTNMKIKNNTEITLRLTGRRTLLAVLVAAGALVGATAFAQSAREIRGASPYVPIENEPAPKLIVDPPLPDPLDQGVVWIQYRECAHRTSVRERCPQRISTGRTSALPG